LPLFGPSLFHFILWGWVAQDLSGLPFVVFGGVASRWGVRGKYGQKKKLWNFPIVSNRSTPLL
jgi:hypothetical protein